MDFGTFKSDSISSCSMYLWDFSVVDGFSHGLIGSDSRGDVMSFKSSADVLPELKAGNVKNHFKGRKSHAKIPLENMPSLMKLVSTAARNKSRFSSSESDDELLIFVEIFGSVGPYRDPNNVNTCAFQIQSNLSLF